MSFDKRSQLSQTDRELNDYLSDTAGDEELIEATPDLRLARILDYEATSLTKPDSLEACVGASNSDLMKIGFHLSTMINPALENLDITNLNQLLPVLDTQLRVARQIERLAQFEARLAETREKAQAAGSSQRRRPIAGPCDRRIR
jgi:hypothetical protein